MDRIVNFEKAFKEEYGKEVEVYRNIEKTVGFITKITTIIKSKGKRFTLTEHLKGEDTDYVILDYKDNSYRFNRYLDAELKVVELMGE